MLALFILGLIAFLCCLVLTPFCRDLFLKLNVVDIPDHRKVHTRAIPRIGGIPIVLSYAISLAVMIWLAPKSATVAVQHRDLMWSLFPAVLMVFLTGLVDDLWNLKASHKLLMQVVAACWAVSMGAQIHVFQGHYTGASWVTFTLSVLWLVGCTNAFNLIDGLDGLASGVGLFATLTTLLAALLQGNWGLAAATVPLVGCLLAFLRYNFNPASVFLGDSGSLTVGFLLGCFGVIWSQKSATLLGMLAPLMAFSLPLFDTGLSIARRFLRNKPIFQPDRGHIHHKLLGHGHHPRTVALILYAFCGIAATLSLLQSSLSYHVGGLIILLFCGLSFFGIQRLDYIEFRTATRVIRKGRIMQLLESEINLAHLRESLSAAATVEDCWIVLRQACKELEFTSVRFTLEGEAFQDTFEPTPLEPVWQMKLVLRDQGTIILTRGANASSLNLDAFLRLVQSTIEQRNAVRGLEIPEIPKISMLGTASRISEAS